jgi:hypothetical protein
MFTIITNKYRCLYLLYPYLFILCMLYFIMPHKFLHGSSCVGLIEPCDSSSNKLFFIILFCLPADKNDQHDRKRYWL